MAKKEIKIFEGKITYANTYKSKNMLMPSAMWNSMMGSQGEYYIKGGNYKLESNGTLNQWQLYIQSENMIYSKISSSSSIYFNEGEENKDEIHEFELNKNVLEVLGYICDEIILTCKSGVQKFYYNEEIGVDPKLFEKHKFVNWYDFVKESNALPLKRLVNSTHFTMESIATEITPMNLDDEMFKLPEGADIKKNPY